MRILFETDFINNISPATTSRLAISYIGDRYFTVNEILKKYFRTYEKRDNFPVFLQDFCDKYLDKTVAFVKNLPCKFHHTVIVNFINLRIVCKKQSYLFLIT